MCARQSGLQVSHTGFLHSCLLASLSLQESASAGDTALPECDRVTNSPLLHICLIYICLTYWHDNFSQTCCTSPPLSTRKLKKLPVAIQTRTSVWGSGLKVVLILTVVQSVRCRQKKLKATSTSQTSWSTEPSSARRNSESSQTVLGVIYEITVITVKLSFFFFLTLETLNCCSSVFPYSVHSKLVTHKLWCFILLPRATRTWTCESCQLKQCLEMYTFYVHYNILSELQLSWIISLFQVGE